MNDRIIKLREISLNTKPYISMERADLITKAYQIYAKEFTGSILRAKVFEYFLMNKKITIEAGELIVGERGPSLQAAPTYPELCCHTVSDLELINKREKIRFIVDEKDIAFHKENIIPFWHENSIRTQILNSMSDEWMNAYYSGIFTEFMEQRAPGHTVADKKVFTLGLNDVIGDIEKELFKDRTQDELDELTAMKICAIAIIKYANRYSILALDMASKESNPKRKNELLKISKTCRNVPAKKASDFQEALQAYWFVHLGVIMELNTWDSFSPGRLDQHLYPFYKNDLLDNTFDTDEIKELLGCFWIKFNNQPAPPKVGITLKESGTYTDFANISIGGISENDDDGVNDLSYIILDIINEMQLLQPSSNIQVSKKNPDEFVLKALNVISEGRGQPSVFNADGIVKQLLNQGKTYQDAIEAGASGCVETGAFGKESYILTGYFNLTKILELTLNNGFDKYTQKQIGLKTGDPKTFKDYKRLYNAYEKQLKYFLNIKLKGNQIIEEIYARKMPAPFMSLFIDDCIKKGKNYNNGGARYNTRYIQGVGIGSVSNSLSSIKFNVFDNGNLTMEELLENLESNFSNNDYHRRILMDLPPKYGNDDDYVDDIMKEVFNSFKKYVDGKKTFAGGYYRINMLPTTCHVYFGSVIGATPDGRKAGKPLSEGISPVQGTDVNGPTAVIKSAGKMEQIKTGGTLLNQKYSPEFFTTDVGKHAIKNMIRAYFEMDGHHIQFNVVDKETLLKAQKNPEEYKDLIVRVAGYSDYFNNLNKDLQDEIINRREYKIV